MSRKRNLSVGLFGANNSMAKRVRTHIETSGSRPSRAMVSNLANTMARRGAIGAGGRVAARLAGRVIPYAGAAMAAYDVGRTVYNAFKKKRTPTRSVGRYQGRFKKTKKPSGKTVYSNKGVYVTSEVHGTVADPDCIYISHCSIDQYECIKYAIYALIRKLFEKANFRVASVDELLISTSITTAVDWRVQLTQLNGTTGVETVRLTHDTVATSTVRSVGNAFLNSFITYSAGQANSGSGTSATDQEQLHRIILYRQDFNVSRADVFEAELRFDEEIMCVTGKSEMKIQNRSLSSTGSADGDDVNNNPLVGRRYYFGSMPKLRDKTGYPFRSLPVNNGVQLVRAATISPGNITWREPPLPTVFTNCKKASIIRLNPGDVKNGTVGWTKSMNFLNFLKRINLEFGAAPGNLVYHSIFPVEMYALEDMINVNAANNINIAYEANKTLGVYFKTRKKVQAVTTYETNTYNNMPA